MLLSITKLQNLKAIHNCCCVSLSLCHVVVNHKTTKFESNSQHYLRYSILKRSCCQSQNYKIWKQFTTRRLATFHNSKLLSITKLQNLKAIHNVTRSQDGNYPVVVNHKTTKFESNSQQRLLSLPYIRSCCQSQNYKIWKQFTTFVVYLIRLCRLLSITKLQNLKAIHNSSVKRVFKRVVVVNHKTTKFGSNSQPRGSWRITGIVVVNHKTTKFESNSQHKLLWLLSQPCCCQSQNYKIWKQFTTYLFNYLQPAVLLSITKLQNLKAIHNCKMWGYSPLRVVVNHKTTKFESNSQQDYCKKVVKTCCCQSQNYKIWKQFTTSTHSIQLPTMLLSITKLQNLKAIHNCGTYDYVQ